MTKGQPVSKHENLRLATAMAKKQVLQTHNMATTRMFVEKFLALKFALSRSTIKDYWNIIEARLASDVEVINAIKNPSAPQGFKRASEL